MKILLLGSEGMLGSRKFYQTTGITMRPWRMALRDCLQKIIT
ncbi:MAG: hypothetical protein Q7I93_06680 [Syntrophales bacterium]|nr:hypothetical protein [Syntrophales bacterium]